jgi:23S rRNA pseudouridine1911/1915/1917 synthase
VKKRIVTVAVGDPLSLGAVLSTRLGLSPSAAGALVERGAVHVQGRRCVEPAAPLKPGARLTVYLSETPPPAELKVIYQDDWLLVVDKPPGVPSQATRGDAASALDAQVARLVPGARLIHRLDKECSGLVLFAARPEACAPLHHALEAGEIDRRYLAVVAGRLDGEGSIGLRIGRDPTDARRRRALPARAPSGQAALSHYRVVGHGHETSTLELRLETGRTHQLRVHLMAIGHPIVGDALYGGPPAPRLALHALRLSLLHPETGRELVFHSPLPPSLRALA